MSRALRPGSRAHCCCPMARCCRSTWARSRWGGTSSMRGSAVGPTLITPTSARWRISGDSIYMGVAGISREGDAIPHPEHKQYSRLSADGVVTVHRTPAPIVKHAAQDSKRPKGVGAPTAKLVLADWAVASAADYTRGES